MVFKDVRSLELNDDDFVLLNDNDMDSIIDTLSDDIMIENIKYQIANSCGNDINTSNLMEYFNDRYKVLEYRYSENEDFMNLLRQSREDYYLLIMRELMEKFKITIGYDLYNNINMENFTRNITKLYEFFVLNHSENINNFLNHYLFNSKEYLVDSYKSETNKKDLEVSTLRKYLKNFDDVVIVSNVEEIVMDLIETDLDSEVIIKWIIEEDPDELTYYLINKIIFDEENEGMITFSPEFNKTFFEPIVKNKYRYVPEIKNYLISIFPKNN